MEINNKRFWDYWNKGMITEALNCPLEEQPKSNNKLQTMLFGTPEQMKQTGVISGISAGEFIYDYVMINPTVVEGLDFARTEDLSSLFNLSQFASGIDTSILSGDMAQIQGYVAEQMLAVELQAKGYDVEFPEASNNPGWDILIDGQPFQVKNLADPAGVNEHLERYPDIPVYVNEELATYFEGNPQVYVSSISREEVLEATTSTLDHADDLLDFEIPWITAGVSSLSNVKRLWSDDVTMNQAILNVASDTTSRVALGAFGQKTGILVGTLLFGPAGGITGAVFGAFVGASHGGKLSTSIKHLFNKKEEQAMISAMGQLLQKVIEQVKIKQEIKKKKMNQLNKQFIQSKVNDSLSDELQHRNEKEIQYLQNKIREFESIHQAINSRKSDVLTILPPTLSLMTKAGVHPVNYQDELKQLQEKIKAYTKRT